MNSEDASAAKSPLEKPLSELTENDIAQITREECRRFLKDKGMRRPSWNKSQVIQQVISLKALLEHRSEDPSSTARIRIKSRSPLPPNLTSSLPSRTMEAPSVQMAKDLSSYRRRDPILADAPCQLLCSCRLQILPESQCLHPSAIPDASAGQLTIFYGGRINVYDGVPSEKAREILQLAAALDPFAAPSAAPRQPELPVSRKASVKRYLEKKKDRYKLRSMELLYLSQKFRGVQNEHLSSSNMTSSELSLPCLPLSRCSSIETKKLGIFIDLNDDGAADNGPACWI